MRRLFSTLIIGTSVLGLMGCGKPYDDPTLNQALPSSLEVDVEELRELKVLKHVPAEGVVGPSNKEFFVRDRRPEISQFPCSSCHSGALSEVSGEPLPAQLREMHVNINLKHAGPETMDCRSCHNPKNMDTLHTPTGKEVAMHQAHQLCVSCHFQQERDWRGGAHGKRLAGWRGKRVVNNCTDCHDPHAPGFAPRMPVTFPSLPAHYGYENALPHHDGHSDHAEEEAHHD